MADRLAFGLSNRSDVCSLRCRYPMPTVHTYPCLSINTYIYDPHSRHSVTHEMSIGSSYSTIIHVQEFRVGALVTVTDLQSVPHLNGKEGRIVSYKADRGRFEIKIDGTENMYSLKPQNLKLAEQVALHAAHKRHCECTGVSSNSESAQFAAVLYMSM